MVLKSNSELLFTHVFHWALNESIRLRCEKRPSSHRSEDVVFRFHTLFVHARPLNNIPLECGPTPK